MVTLRFTCTLVVLGAVSLAACDTDDDAGPEPTVDAGLEPTVDAGPEATIDGSPPAEGPIPSEPEALLAWLEGGGYLQWDAETGPHQSTGPHFGQVRTFVEPSLLASLAAGNTEHPAGAAAVKELYGNGDTVRGWSVSIKLQADSAAGDGWFWYERYNGNVYGSGTGVGLCTGCHDDGIDYVLTPFPLQ
jgi:hypothetical protein